MKTNIFKNIFFIVLILLIGISIYMLYKDGKKEKNSIENNELKININGELNIGITGYDTINPILSYNRDIQYVDKLIFEPLLDISYKFKIENKLAKEFSKINNITYIVKLKDDVYWHDGTKFTAKDVVFTIENLKNNDIKSIYKENVQYIKELQQIDDYTIKIILEKEVPFFEYMMCFPILASHCYQENTLNCNQMLPIGTGKFKITKIENENILIEKFNYDNESKITKINLILKGTSNDLYLALTKNEIDLMVTDNIRYEDYVGSIGYNITKYPNREFDYLVLNNENSILKDKDIRKAINYSIDKNKINYNIYNNRYSICSFALDYGSYLYDGQSETEYDINKARDIFLEKGWTIKKDLLSKNGKNLRLRLLVDKDNEKRLEVAENIKEQLKEIGIIIDIIAVNNKQVDNYIKNKNYDIVLTGNIISNSPNLETFFGDNNLSNFRNVEVNNILNEIRSIGNQEEKLKENYIRLKGIYEEELPYIGLYFNSIFILSNNNLKGDLSGNWYNIYYNIDNWYKVIDN